MLKQRAGRVSAAHAAQVRVDRSSSERSSRPEARRVARVA
jgi:hypothetical protein